MTITFTNKSFFINEYNNKILSDMHVDKKFNEDDDDYYKGYIYYNLPCDKKNCTFTKPHIFKIYLYGSFEFYRTITKIKNKDTGVWNETKTKYGIKKINIDYNYELKNSNVPFIEYKPYYSEKINSNISQINYDNEKIIEASKQFYKFQTLKGKELFSGYPSSILPDRDSVIIEEKI